MYTSRPCALGRKQSNEGLGDCLQEASSEEVSPSSSFYNSSYFILLERRVGVGFTELFFASRASLKNLKMDGKLFQEVSSWRSVPAEQRGQSDQGMLHTAAGPVPGASQSNNSNHPHPFPHPRPHPYPHPRLCGSRRPCGLGR